MITFDNDFLKTESDVEQKVLYPLLNKVLGYSESEIKTKYYIPKYDIGKRAGKKYGYYPDYLVTLAGLPCIIIEAKKPDEDITEGYREARLYAAEINSLYPTELNPCKYIISSDGRSILFGQWDDAYATKSITIEDLSASVGSARFFSVEFSRDKIFNEAYELRMKLYPARFYKPLRFVGGESRQNASISMNTFASDLTPLLRRYFDPDETKWSEEVLEKGYCSSDEITGYNGTLESLLKEGMQRKNELNELRTSKKSAACFDDMLRKTIKEKANTPDPLILLLGGVGSGKSMFVERYTTYLASDEVKRSTLWVNIDFNKASDDDVANFLDDWIRRQFNSIYINEFCEEDCIEYDLLTKIFAPDINGLRKGQFKKIYENFRDEYDKKESEFLNGWLSSPAKLAKNIIRYYAGDKQINVVVVFDNVDRKDKEQQLKIFQSVQSFREENKCFCILSLRDETYDAYKGEPPLDAYLNPFAFRIITPRFIDVVKRRLELMLNYLSLNTPDLLQYTLPNGAVVSYPSTELGKYIFSLYLSVFAPARMTSTILQAISGSNIRRALEMFAEILVSGYVKESTIFSLTRGGAGHFPEYLLIKILMRRNNRFYHERDGYIKNILSMPERSKTANNFLMIEVLSYLAVRRKVIGSLRIEGYQLVADLESYFNDFGYSKEDVTWVLEHCLYNELVQADHQRKKGINQDCYVKITASGYYHLRHIATREEYLKNIAFDTFINDHETARCIGEKQDDTKSNHLSILSVMERYLTSEFEKMSEYSQCFNKNQLYSFEVITNYQRAIDRANNNGKVQQ